MLSVAKLTPGQEAYYERSVAAGLDDYYAGKGESPGEWAGSGAAGLGLEGAVEEGELGSLIRGRDPQRGEELRAPVKARTITIERIDPESGKRWMEEKKLAPVAGFDLVFSTPKSVSLLHALGDEETREAVAEAHRSAWRAALAYLEAEACVTRRGKDGYLRERGGGFVAAAYQHRTSRATDPHLHTHVIVANMTRSPSDGEWRALDGEAILKTYRLAAGYLYEAQLRFELSARLGLEWETPSKGWAEVKGVPRAIIDAFSTRRAQVVEHMAEQGTSGFYAAQVAAVASRERKEELDLPRLRKEWAARAAEQGLGRRELDSLLHRSPHREPTPAELVAHAERLLGPEGLTEKRSAFSEPEVVMAWAEAHAQGAPEKRIRALSARFLELGGVERVSEAPPPGKAAYYSTTELLRIEREALALVERGQGAGAPVVAGELIEALLASRPDHLSPPPEQERMVRGLAASPDRVLCVVGPAGSGKTSALRAAAEAFAASGVSVLGAAPSGIAAERLADKAGIPATTLHGLLAAARREGGLPQGSVLVVDEAGMADTRILAPLLSLVEEAKGKAILLGDPRQLPAVGAGGLFAAIAEQEGAIQLRDNRRQRDELERRTLEAVRGGLGREYLAFAEREERLTVSEDPLETRARLLADWWDAAKEDLSGSVMIALRRRRGRRPERGRTSAHGGRRKVGGAAARGSRHRLLRRRPHRVSAQLSRARCPQRHPRDGHGTRPGGGRARGGDRPRRGGGTPARLPGGGPRPARLRAHRPRRAGAHGRARLRARPDTGAPAGVGLRRPLPRPHGDTPVRHRARGRAREPLPRARRQGAAHAGRAGARGLRRGTARKRTAAAPGRAAAREPPSDRPPLAREARAGERPRPPAPSRGAATPHRGKPPARGEASAGGAGADRQTWLAGKATRRASASRADGARTLRPSPRRREARPAQRHGQGGAGQDLARGGAGARGSARARAREAGAAAGAGAPARPRLGL